MATDWAADVRKYAADADDAVIKGLVRYCGIALQKPDSSLVSFSDPTELARVRNNFLKKKCGLTDADDVLDAAIAKVGERMKDDRTKNRVTVYYLLAEHFDLHHLFVKGAVRAEVASAAPLAPVALAGAGVAAAGSDSADADVQPPVAEVEAPVTAPIIATADAADAKAGLSMAAAPLAVAAVADDAAGAGERPLMPFAAATPLGHKLHLGKTSDGSGAGLLWFALVGFGALALFALIPNLLPREATLPAAAAPAVPAAPVGTAAPAAAAIPAGAGVISETRDAAPLIKVYFDTGKAEVSPEIAPATDTLRAYLTANPAATLAISGYNDPTGNAALNAELSKDRAQAVQATLIEAGIPADKIALVKPEATTDATVSPEEARRVEISVR